MEKRNRIRYACGVKIGQAYEVRLDRLAEGVLRRPTEQHWIDLRSEIEQAYGVNFKQL